MEWQQWVVINLIIIRALGDAFIASNSKTAVGAMGTLLAMYLYYIALILTLYSGGFFTE